MPSLCSCSFRIIFHLVRLRQAHEVVGPWSTWWLQIVQSWAIDNGPLSISPPMSYTAMWKNSKIEPSLSLCPTYQFLFVHVLSWFIFVPHSTNEQNWALRALKNYTRMNITSDSRLDAVLLVLSTQSWHLSANWFWSKSLITFTFRAFSLFLVSFEGGFTKKILYFGGNACKKNEIASWQKFVKSGQQ